MFFQTDPCFHFPIKNQCALNDFRNVTFQSDHDINPRADTGLGFKKDWIGQIHRTGIGNSVVDGDEFPMLAQVLAPQSHT